MHKPLLMGALAAVGMAAMAKAADYSCFERTYSDAHLAANKMQVVRMLRVRLPQARSDEAKAWATFRKSPAQIAEEQAAAEAASAKNEEAPEEVAEASYDTTLICWAPSPGSPEGAWQCGVECDGGSFTAWADGNGGLLLRTKGGFAVHGGCGEELEDGEDIRWVTDLNAIQTTFRLSPVAETNCKDKD